MSAISGYSSSYSNYSNYSGQVRERPSEEQMAAMKKAMYDKADADGSGGLSKTELTDFLAKGPNGDSIDSESTFTSFDSDGDGSISEDEMDKGMQSLRSQMESNMNKARFGGEQGQGMGDMMSPPPPPPNKGLSDSDGSSSSSKNIMSSLDSDGDGTIDEEELTTGLSSTKVQEMISAYIKQMSSSYSTSSDSLLSTLTA